jgi:hypothetical protein
MQSELVKYNKTNGNKKVAFTGCPSVGTSSTKRGIITIHMDSSPNHARFRLDLTIEDAEFVAKSLNNYIKQHGKATTN